MAKAKSKTMTVGELRTMIAAYLEIPNASISDPVWGKHDGAEDQAGMIGATMYFSPLFAGYLEIVLDEETD